MTLEATVIQLVTHAIEAAGLEVVLAKIDGRRHVRVLIDREPGGVKVADCATANRAAKHALADNGIDGGAFHLEVLSPGVDRPLTRAKDFVRFAGSVVWVHLSKKRGDRRKFKGKLVGQRDGKTVIHEDVTGDEMTFDPDEIEETRLVPAF